jgi:hypothetical protein
MGLRAGVAVRGDEKESLKDFWPKFIVRVALVIGIVGS